MPATKVIKTKPVEATRKTLEKTKPVKVTAVTGAHTELKVPPVRKSRASSCPRRDGTGAQRPAAQTSCGRRTRSSSTAPGLSSTAPGLSSTAPGLSSTAPGLSTTAPGLSSTAPGRSSTAPGLSSTWPRANPDCRKAQREQRGVRAQTTPASQSHKAFTVIPPDPKKRREIQRKAEAELAALEELRLSRAMAYVSINPSSVGGCMSLEEVRSKQQQEMMQAKRKPMKTQAMEQTPVLRS